MDDLLQHAKHCPWGCASGVWVWDKAVPGRFSIACSDPGCAATGPVRDSVAEAVIAWNAAPRRKAGPDSRSAFRRAHDEMHPPGAAENDLEQTRRG